MSAASQPTEPTERKHGRGCYARPCELGEDCQARKDEAREYQRKRRADAAAKRAREGKPPKLSVVRSAPQAAPPVQSPSAPAVEGAGGQPGGRDGGPGESMVGAIRAAIASIPEAATARPELVALALSLAALIDAGDPMQRVSAAKEIRSIMGELRPAKAAESAGPSKRDEFFALLSAPLTAAQ